MRSRTSRGRAGRPVRCRLFQVQKRRKPCRCHAMTVSGLTMCTAERQPCHDRESHAQSIRSTRVKRRRGRRDRFTTASWWRRATISRCSEARDRATHRSEWSSDTTTETTLGGYRRSSVTSIDATRPELSVATGCRLRRISHRLRCRRAPNSACVTAVARSITFWTMAP